MIYSFVGLILKIWIQSAAYLSYESVLNDKYQYIYWYIVLSIYEYNIYHAKQLLGWYLSISWYGQFLRWCNGYISDSLGYANQYPFRIVTTHHGDNLLDQAVCFGKFFWCFSWGFQINMRQTGENHLGSSFFSDFGMPKMLFSWNSKVKHHSFSEISPSDFVRCLFGAALPPLPQPRSDQTTSVIIRADFNIFNFRKLASPFPSLQGTFQKHFQLPNLPPLFQTFRHHQGHQGPQGPRFRQIFGLQIAPQWSHRHRD